jgi:16S rRNA (guanine1207-N2)-methyltransferase
VATTSEFPYYQLCDFLASIGGQNIRVISKPGLPHWDEISPAVELLAKAACQMKAGPALVLGCGNGALGVALFRQGRAENLRLVDASWAALRVAKLTLEANGAASVLVEPLQYPLPLDTYQTVIMSLPKGRKLARRWLVEAWGALRPGGELYLAGANPEGIQAVIKDAGSLFGNATVLAYRKGCRVARMLKQSLPGAAPERDFAQVHSSEHEWAAEPGLSRGSWIEFTASVGEETFSLCSLPGVFSSDHVDDGTALLLEQLTRSEVQGRRVLDFGCGYGLIGMTAARLGAAWVDLLDVDLCALAAAQKNCTRNQISHARTHPSDVLDAIDAERYDLILSNPPFHAGKQVEYGMAHTFIANSRAVLLPGGRLVLVANRFIPYDRLLQEVFGNVNRLAETGKFHVLESVR